MKFTIQQRILVAGLGFLTKIIDGKSTMPVLETVKIQAGTNGVVVTATNLDRSATITLESADVTVSGAALLPLKKLAGLVKTFQADAAIAFALKDTECTVQCGNSKNKLRSFSVLDFPDLNFEPKGTEFEIASKQLLDALEFGAISATNEESRYALNGVRVETVENKLILVATDGHRLSYTELAEPLSLAGLPLPAGAVNTIIPKASVGAIIEMLKLTPKVAITHDPSSGEFAIKSGDRSFTTRGLSGQFPNYDLVIPKKDLNFSFVVDAQLIREVVQRVALLADERSHSIRMEFSPTDGIVKVSGQTETGSSDDQVSVENSIGSEDVTIGFNATYLSELASALKGHKLRFEFKDGNTPVKITPIGTEVVHLGVVMPMRLP